MLEIPDLTKIEAAVKAYPEAAFLIFVTGLGLGWGASWLLARRELRVNRSIIEAVKNTDISETARNNILQHSLPQRGRLKLVARSLAVLAIIAVCAGLGIAYFSTPGIANLIGRLRGIPPPALVSQIFLQCDFATMPKNYPPSGEIFVLESTAFDPMKDAGNSGGLTKYFGAPNGELEWSTEKKSFEHGYKCQVFDYGYGPLFDVRLIFDVLIRKANKNNDGGSFVGGDTIKTTQWGAYIPKVDRGPDKAFVFYIYNRWWPNFVQINLPPKATYVKDSKSERVAIDVLSNNYGRPIFLDPQVSNVSNSPK